MAGKITALKIQKNNKERVNVFIDEVYTLAVTVMVAATLKKGQYLSDADIEQLKNEDERHKAYQRALHYLSFRARSRAEMERYLQDKGYSPEIVTEIIERLQRERYLDDQAFAEMWLENRERLRPRGRRALRYELRQKGIDETVLDTVLADLDEDELAWAAVEPKLNSWKNLSEKDLKKKLMGFLGRRGFNYEIARSVFEQARQILHSSE